MISYKFYSSLISTVLWALHISRIIYDSRGTLAAVDTGTPHVEAAAHIAEFGTASASHVVAALSLFDPHGALRALLKFRALHKLLKGLVEQVRVTVSLKFFTWLSLMSIRFAIQAIFLFAFDTLEIFAISPFIEYKSIVAVRSWAPWNIPLLRECLL